MKKATTLLILAVALLLNSCSSVPITGRKQLNLVSDQTVLQSSLASYTSFMTSAKQANKLDRQDQERPGGACGSEDCCSH